MASLNQVDLDKLDRHELHLSILAAVFVLVLAAGVALLMYPLVFVRPDESNKWSLRFAFLGFCVLSILFVIYLFDRQRTVRRLKQNLLDELERNVELRHQANVDLLHTIPDLGYFQDRLVMECRRASSLERPLSLVIVKLKLSSSYSGEAESATVLGEAARALSRNLRQTDSIYVLAEGLFGLVLPDSDSANAKRVALRLDETLKSVGAPNRFSCELLTRNYPEQVQSAREFEEIVSSMLPTKEPWAEAVEKL